MSNLLFWLNLMYSIALLGTQKGRKMILKEKHTFSDDSVHYALIDNVERIEVGEDLGTPRRFIKIYKINRKDPKEYEKLYVDENIIYVCNDQGKTLEKVTPVK